MLFCEDGSHVGSSLKVPMSFQPSDDLLVDRFRNGDERAADDLYERYAHRLIGLIASRMNERLRTRTEPEDVLQSVLRSVFMGVRSGQYNAPEGATLWNLMSVIAVRKVRNHYRAMLTQRRDAKVFSLDDPESWDDAVGDESLQLFETSFRELIEPLRADEQQIVTLRLQMHTVEEIAQIIGRSRRSVERILQNCRSRLSQQLNQADRNETTD
ncbi:RNA polymerase sigma factor [Crateriforma conspicua]|uniref:RNA polymerase sigma factor n=2 Tax=Crateriforma conspicua TaxID=2527996 RepID=A0A5C5Y6R4_9PLAN|nr:RNA polymerase sigma factor [Crateriforma conspicua]TWT70331.1 RNA polymerase sigma factor [Crateriforma conspicua]